MQNIFQQHISLKKFNTFNIDVEAKYFSLFTSLQQLGEKLQKATEANIPFLILGGGSNVLFTNNFEGVVLKNEIDGIEIEKQDEKFTFVKAGAGVIFDELVKYCIANNLYGIENLSLIPGTVGAAPIQNIGAYGVEICELIENVFLWNIEKQKQFQLSNVECNFGYRNSIFKNELKNKVVVLAVKFKLKNSSNFNLDYADVNEELKNRNIKTLSLQVVSDVIRAIRTRKLPDINKFGNAGSFFKNPVIALEKFEALKNLHSNFKGYEQSDGIKISAAWLIEQCGWKQKRFENCGCYENQPLVLVNYGNATGNEIFSLSEEIIKSVKQKFDILLEREVNIIV